MSYNHSIARFSIFNNTMGRILRARGRLGGSPRPLPANNSRAQQSLPSPFGNVDPNTVNGTQQNSQQGGFGFGQQASGASQSFGQSNTNSIQQSTLQSASFPPFGTSSNTGFQSQISAPSSNAFNFASGQAGILNNPFAASGNTSGEGDVPATSFGGYQGSIFNIPPQDPPAPPATSGNGSNGETHSIFGRSASQSQPSQPMANIFGQSSPSLQASTNVFGQTNSRNQPPSSFFAKSVPQPESMSNNFGLSNAQSQSSGSIFGMSAAQPQTTSNIFGHLAPPSQTSSNPFGPSANQPQTTTGIFGQPDLQSQPLIQEKQSNTDNVQNDDSMMVSPEKSVQSQTSYKQPGPFAFLNSDGPSSIERNAIQSQGLDTSDSITRTPLSLSNSATNGQNAAVVNDTKTKSPFVHYGEDAEQPEDFVLGVLPNSIGGSRTEEKPRTKIGRKIARPKGVLTPEANSSVGEPVSTASVLTPLSTPVAQSVRGPNPFATLKSKQKPDQPPATAPPVRSSQGTSQASRVQKNTKIPRKGLATSRTASAARKSTTIHNTEQILSKIEQSLPADFTDLERRQVVTAYQLQALDANLRKHILESKAFFPVSDDVFDFYMQQKEAILSAATNRVSVEDGTGNEINTKGKRARIDTKLRGPKHRPTTQKALSNGPLENDNGVPQSSTGLSTPASQAQGAKRKADEPLTKDNANGVPDGAKKSRGNDQVSYPSLPSPSNGSKTSNIFKNIIGETGDDSSAERSSSESNGGINIKSSQNTDTWSSSHSSATPKITTQEHSFPTSDLFQPKTLAPLSSNSDELGSSTAPLSPLPSISTTQTNTPYSAFSNATAMSNKLTTNVPASLPAPKSQQLYVSTLSSSANSTSASPFSIKTPMPSSGAVDSPSFKVPTFGAGAPSNFLSQFGKAAKESAEKEKAKRKAENFDSDEDDEAEWERKDAEEQRMKKQRVEQATKGTTGTATFVPGKGFLLVNADGGKGEVNHSSGLKSRSGPVDARAISAKVSPNSTANTGTSIFDNPKQQGLKDPLSYNIFSHLSDNESGAESGKNDDAEDEVTRSEQEGNYDDEEDLHSKQPSDGARYEKTKDLRFQGSSNPVASSSFATEERANFSQEPTNKAQSSGRSLFDRISLDEDGIPVREIPPANKTDVDVPLNLGSSQGNSNIFGQANQNAGSIFDRVSSSTASSSIPITPTSSTTGSTLFGKASIGSNIFGNLSSFTPSSNIFGSAPPESTPEKAIRSLNGSPGGDQTWKQDSPIKFASSSSIPSTSITAPTPAKTDSIEQRSSPSTLGALFGSNFNALEPGVKPTMTSFNGSPAKSASASFGFAFGGPPKPTTGSLAPLLDTNSNTTSRATSPGSVFSTDAANDSHAEGTEGEAAGDQVEHHEQLDLTAGGPGEEDEDVVFEVKAKALTYNKDYKDNKDKKDEKGWLNKGHGPLRVLKHRETGKTRILLRQDPSGRIVLNAALMGTMKYEYVNPSAVRMGVATDAGSLATWTIRVKKDEDAVELSRILEVNKSK